MMFKIQKIREFAGYFLIAFVFSTFILSLPVVAENTTDGGETVSNDKDGNLSVGGCLQQGNLDMRAFLNSLIYIEGYMEALNPLLDLTSRNSCQVEDIFRLQRARDQVKSLLRDAFFNCHNGEIPGLKQAYYKSVMEIYYVRHITNTVAASVKLPMFSLSTLQLRDPNTFFTDDNELYSDMYETFILKSKFMTTNDFTNFYNQLKSKYKDRKMEYVTCHNSSFEEVTKKFMEFISDYGGVKKSSENLAKSIVGGGEKLVQALTDTSYKGYVSGLLNLRINGMPVMQGFNEIVDEFAKNSPDFTGNVGQDAIYNAVNSQAQVYDVEKKKTELKAEFEAIYKNTSDQSFEYIIASLEDMNQTIEDSIPIQGKILNCVETINNKQCQLTE